MRPLLTVNDLARVLCVSPATIHTRRTRARHLLPRAVKLPGGGLRWRPADVEAFLNQHAEHAPR